MISPLATASATTPVISEAVEPLHGRDLLCFSHDWTGDPLSKTHLMRLLARDNRVLWVNSIGNRTPTLSKADVTRAFRKLAAASADRLRQVEPNIFVLNPLAVPLYGNRWARQFNRWFLKRQVLRAMRRLDFRRPINWIFNPAAAVIAGELGEEQLIYYCVDEYSAFSGVSAQSIAELETALLRKADLVLVSAERLYRSKSPFNPRTVLIQHGVDYAHFRSSLDPETVIPPEVRELPRPVIGFFGLIADWVDLDLLARVAREFPEGSLVLIGKATVDLSRLHDLPNVHILGQKPFESLPGYCKAFDVGLIPFAINELTLNTNPLKAREYVAAGLPVVSTAVPEVRQFPGCRVADSDDAFIHLIRASLSDTLSRHDRSALMQSESWACRLDEIRGHLAALPG